MKCTNRTNNKRVTAKMKLSYSGKRPIRKGKRPRRKGKMSIRETRDQQGIARGQQQRKQIGSR